MNSQDTVRTGREYGVRKGKQSNGNQRRAIQGKQNKTQRLSQNCI